MKKVKYLLNHLGHSRIKLFILIIDTIFIALLGLLSSLIFSFVIDNVISQEPITMPFLKYIANILGGVNYIRNHLYLVALLLVVIYFIYAILLNYRQRNQAILAESLIKNMRDELYNHIDLLPYAYHVRVKTGELIQKCTSDIDVVRRFFSGQFIEIFYILATAIIALIIFFNINVKLALYASISLPIIFVYSYIFFKKVQKQFLLSDESEAIMTSIIQESLSGVRVVKAFNKENHEIERLRVANENYRHVTYKMIKYLGGYWSSSYLICLLGILSVVIMGIFAVLNNEITIGNFIIFVSYQSMILFPIRQLGRILSDFGKVTVSLDRLIEIIDTPKEDVLSGDKPNLNGDIKFINVCFAYDDDHIKILHDLNMHIKKGSQIAILGPTGSGKSSLIHLLSRLYDVTSGDILINNHNIKDINLYYLRDNVGIVLQEPFLFSKSIIDNLRIVKPNASDEEIYHACKIAHIHDVILSFDKAYNTLIGEKGVTLSGGQKQRLAIARTILKGTKILIFDDSLSAVDTKTDMEIRESLKELTDITTIIITSRVSSASNCDYIYVLEDGRITQEGKHNYLINTEGLYKRISEIQSNIKLEEEEILDE